MSPPITRRAARARRWEILGQRFPQLSEMRVVDLGGEPEAWLRAPVRPREVVLLNLSSRAEQDRAYLRQLEDLSWLRIIVGDACEAAPILEGEQFDLVYSNSVIEHVGGHFRRMAFADSVLQLAEHHWIQTPYRYFPIEPHMFGPGFQFMPLRARAAAIRVWPIGNVRRPGTSVRDRVADVAEFELLSLTEFRYYFPESSIVHEKLLGVTKSLIAVR